MKVKVKVSYLLIVNPKANPASFIGRHDENFLTNRSVAEGPRP